MLRSSFAFLTLFSLLLSNGFAKSLNIGIGENPPYHFEIEGQIQGSVIDLMECAMEQAEIDYQLEQLPWQRLLSYLRSGRIDVALSLNTEQYFLEHSSVPLVAERWYWYSKRGNAPNLNDTIIAISGSSQAFWLSQQSYSRVEFAPNYDSAIRMILLDRGHYMLIDQLHYDYIQQEVDGTKDLILGPFAHFSTLSALFTRRLVQDDFEQIQAFNKSILSCHPIGVALDQRNKEVLISVLDNLKFEIASWFLADNEVINEGNSETFTTQGINQIEIEWRQEEPTEKVKSITSNLLSKKLKDIYYQYEGLLTEIIVTDRYGRNVAISHMTTDYFQGDEFDIEALINDPLGGSISDIYYDESTRQFQSKITIPVFKNGNVYAVIILGVDMEFAYALYG